MNPTQSPTTITAITFEVADGGESNTNPSAFETCPPQTLYQVYECAAIDAVNEEYGAVINDLSEEAANIVMNAAVTAVNATLKAAHISDDWREIIKPSKKCSCLMHRKLRTWDDQGPANAQDLYRLMAWQAQYEKFPHLFCELKGVDDDLLDELMDAINYMLNFALTAAGVADDWTKLFNTVQAKLESK